MHNEIHLLFGTPVYISGDSYNLPEEDLFHVNTQETYPNQGGNTTSKNSYILEQFPDLKDWILDQIELYKTEVLKIQDEVFFGITQSWLNYNSKKSFHHSHNHRNSVISGVFYVEGTTPIRFERKDHYFPQFDFNYSEYTNYNSSQYDIQVSPGKLFLFPSLLNHSVLSNEDDKVRISLAFNTWMKGTIGDTECNTRLKL